MLRLTRRGVWACAVLVGLAGVARADAVPGAPSVVDSSVGGGGFVAIAGLGTGVIDSGIYRDAGLGILTAEYTMSIAMSASIRQGDVLTFRGFGGDVISSVILATIPYEGPLSGVPPVPFQSSRSADGDSLVFTDWRSIVTDPGEIHTPLQIRVATTSTSYGMGTAELDRDGVAIATFDTLVPVPAPEPPTIYGAVVAAVVGWGVRSRRRIASSREGQSRRTGRAGGLSPG
jgi:hypothetical protein